MMEGGGNSGLSARQLPHQPLPPTSLRFPPTSSGPASPPPWPSPILFLPLTPPPHLMRSCFSLSLACRLPRSSPPPTSSGPDLPPFPPLPNEVLLLLLPGLPPLCPQLLQLLLRQLQRLRGRRRRLCRGLNRNRVLHIQRHLPQPERPEWQFVCTVVQTTWCKTCCASISAQTFAACQF